ncbi:MAG TPA: HD domain-containing protein [Ktedonobacteraceae bacterium]|nr:HD domain-containing protein [Ktedonobacteraceae bacterium]
MDSAIVQAAAVYAEQTLGKEAFLALSAVVATCKMLALALAEQVEEGEAREVLEAPDLDALVTAAYLHNISVAEFGYQAHHQKSAQMAVEFLRKLDVPDDRMQRVERAILLHTSATSNEERASGPPEGRILYDADKLGRLSGLSVVTSLIEFGARYPNLTVTNEVLVAILRHVEERFVNLYQSLNTGPARRMAQVKFGNTLAFLDGVIEYLDDATPI